MEIELQDILGSEKCLSKLPDGKNDCIWSSQHWIRRPQASHHLYSCGILGFRIFLAMKDACRTSTTVTMTLSDLPSTATVHKHCGYERCLYNLHDGDSDFIWFSQHWNRSSQASHNHYICQNWILVLSCFRNTTAQPPQNHYKSENDTI